MNNLPAQFQGMNLPAEIQSQLQQLQQHFEGAVMADFPPKISLKYPGISVVQDDTVLVSNQHGTMNMVLVEVAKSGSNIYFETAYDPNNSEAGPTCWSSNGQTPDPEVPIAQRQNPTCKGCRWKEDNSNRAGRGKACSFRKRVIAVIEEVDPQTGEETFDFKRPVIFDVNATSAIGSGEKLANGYNLDTYLKMLLKNRSGAIPPNLVVTRVTREMGASNQFVVSFNVAMVTGANGAQQMRFIDANQMQAMLEEFNAGVYSDMLAINGGSTQEVPAPDATQAQVGYQPQLQQQSVPQQQVQQPVQQQQQYQQPVQQPAQQQYQQPVQQPEQQQYQQPVQQPEQQQYQQPVQQPEQQQYQQPVQQQYQQPVQQQQQPVQQQQGGGLVADMDLNGFSL